MRRPTRQPESLVSCGRFTIQALFARSDAKALGLARKLIAAVKALGDVQVVPQKTRLVFVARVRFAGLVPRRDHVVATFALQRELKNSRIERVIDYGPRWQAHQIRIRSIEDIDPILRSWLEESYRSVGCKVISCTGGPGRLAR